MKSSIKIDFLDNGNGLEPIIKVSLQDTEDIRDGLLKTFFQKLGGESSWLRVEFMVSGNDSGQIIFIYPVTPYELEKASQEISERFRSLSQGGE